LRERERERENEKERQSDWIIGENNYNERTSASRLFTLGDFDLLFV